MPEEKKRSVGAVWNKTSKNGATNFLSISLDLNELGLGEGKMSFIAFNNDFKQGERDPDWRIFESTPMQPSAPQKRPAAPAPKTPSSFTRRPQPQAARPAQRPAPARPAAPQPEPEPAPEDNSEANF